LASVLCAGSFVCDIIAAGLDHMAAPGELVYAPQGIDLKPGGHSANVAIDLAQLGITGVAAVGGLGNDLFGEFMEGELVRLGLDVHPERFGELHTAKNLAIIVEGEDRRFIAELTANTMLSPGHVISTLEDSRPKVFYLGTVGGLRLVDESLVEVMQAAKSMGCATMLDVIMPHGFGWDHLTQALRFTDILHCNETESVALTGLSDPSKAARRLTDLGAGLAIVTLGPDGLVAASKGVRLRMPAFEIDAVDPTGAGDAFSAGLLSALLKSRVDLKLIDAISRESLMQILLEGEAAGAACVTAIGASTAVNRENVDKLITEQGESVLKTSTDI